MGTQPTLKDKVLWLRSLINTEKIAKSSTHSVKTVRRYYRVNGWAYRKFHSVNGFMHFRVSFGEKIEKNDIYYQPDTISDFIPPNGRVAELGPGQGANIVYLAKKRPDVSFVGFDLLPPKLKDAPTNIKLYKQDYSNLDAFEENSFDLVFGIETVVHCPDKDKVFAAVNRILKPGGIFIVYDYALSCSYDSLDDIRREAALLIAKGGACPMIEEFGDWKAHFDKNGFEEMHTTDLSKEIMPDLDRLRRKACRIIDNKRRMKLVFRLSPGIFANNIIIGYLGYDVFKEGLVTYKEWIYRKKDPSDARQGGREEL